MFLLLLVYTSPRCIILMPSRYWLQSWPTAISSNVLRHVTKQCWTVLHHAGPYYYQGNPGAFKCTCTSFLLHFYWLPVLLWLLHAVMWLLLQSLWILLSVGAYGCALTHGAMLANPSAHSATIGVWWCTWGTKGALYLSLLSNYVTPDSAPPYFIIISCPVSL